MAVRRLAWPKSPSIVYPLTDEEPVLTRKLTGMPLMLPTSARIQPGVQLGLPLDVTPAKEKVVTSPHSKGGKDGGAGCRGGAGGEDPSPTQQPRPQSSSVP